MHVMLSSLLSMALLHVLLRSSLACDCVSGVAGVLLVVERLLLLLLTRSRCSWSCCWSVCVWVVAGAGYMYAYSLRSRNASQSLNCAVTLDAPSYFLGVTCAWISTGCA